jgi:N6-L-threonylcarbamoyladenine synthase
MIILGLESSCDDTSAAVIKDGKVLSLVINTQIEHTGFGGVIPEIASRAHLKNFPSVLNEAVKRAGISLSEINAIAVTYGPGLVGPLLVGVNFAKGLSFSLGLPVIPVNHIEAHISANFIDDPDIVHPFVVLVVSGGHTELIFSSKPGNYEMIGKTKDDAAGECIDKVSKMLGLGFPGGKVMDDLSKKGDRDFERFPRGMHDSLDFSFSGLKTSLKYYIEKHDADFLRENIENIAASFLDSVTDSLTSKLFRAAKELNVRTVLLAGGVSANSMLREKVMEMSEKRHIKCIFSRPVYCTDNAAMVAIAAYRKIMSDGLEKYRFDPSLDAYLI